MEIMKFRDFKLNESSKKEARQLVDSNIQLVKFYRDANGNSTAKFETHDGYVFKIQTNGNLPKTDKLINTELWDLTRDDLEKIKNEVQAYTENYFDKKKFAKLKWY